MTLNEKTLRNPSELADAGLIGLADVADLNAVSARYAIALSPEMAGLIKPGDPIDPIARHGHDTSFTL